MTRYTLDVIRLYLTLARAARLEDDMRSCHFNLWVASHIRAQSR